LGECSGFRRPLLDDPDGIKDFGYGFLRAFECTATAAVAELRKDQHLLWQHGDGVILADLRAAAAMGALGLVHLGDEDAHLFPTLDGRPEEEVGVGLFHVTVQKQRFSVAVPGRYGESQTHGHGGFARTSFAAGNGDFHGLLPHHPGAALGAAHLVARDTDLMGHFMAAVGANAVTAGPSAWLRAAHAAPTSTTSQATASAAASSPG